MATTFPRPSYGDRIANLTERCVEFDTLPDARARLGAIADTTEGLGADPAPDGQKNFWYDCVCPEWQALRSNREYQNMRDWDEKSSCALAVASHLRRLGVRSPFLRLDADGIYLPYKDATAVGNIYELGGTSDPKKPGKAWIVAGTTPPPENVIVLIGEDGAEHMFTTRRVSLDMKFLENIEGGQIVGTIPNTSPPKGYQGILRKSRTWVESAGRLFLDGRPIIGWLDPNLLDLVAPPTYDFV